MNHDCAFFRIIRTSACLNRSDGTILHQPVCILVSCETCALRLAGGKRRRTRPLIQSGRIGGCRGDAAYSVVSPAYDREWSQSSDYILNGIGCGAGGVSGKQQSHWASGILGDHQRSRISSCTETAAVNYHLVVECNGECCPTIAAL